jgi:hypothetical protein
MNRTAITIVGAIVVVVIAIALLVRAIPGMTPNANVTQNQPGTNQVACAQDAKLCPDGSYVSRVAPSCEFAPCPTLSTAGWKTFNDTTNKVSFQYPEKLPTTYITTADWPPKLQITNGPYTCNEAGSENATAGQTSKQTINGREYCVTKETQGAAGSIYTQYAYEFASGNKVDILTFSLRFVQCANYDEPKKTECESERTTFDINPIVDRIAQTLVAA